MGASPRFALLALATCLFSFPFTRPIFFFRTHRWCLYFDLQLLHDIVSVGISISINIYCIRLKGEEILLH